MAPKVTYRQKKGASGRSSATSPAARTEAFPLNARAARNDGGRMSRRARRLADSSLESR
ncbi:hypothetical protein GCM10007886_09490 [Methylobacterium gregans]|nr:hypothetical protein GCM10007886_09490 [Methylobacterium gregans]